MWYWPSVHVYQQIEIFPSWTNLGSIRCIFSLRQPRYQQVLSECSDGWNVQPLVVEQRLNYFNLEIIQSDFSHMVSVQPPSIKKSRLGGQVGEYTNVPSARIPDVRRIRSHLISCVDERFRLIVILKNYWLCLFPHRVVVCGRQHQMVSLVSPLQHSDTKSALLRHHGTSFQLLSSYLLGETSSVPSDGANHIGLSFDHSLSKPDTLVPIVREETSSAVE